MARDVRRETNKYRNTYESNVYVYGNTARRLDVQREYEQQEYQAQQLSNEAKKNREKAKNMSLGYVLFIVAALGMCVMVLMGYIKLQTEITALQKETMQQEKLLNSLRIENAEARTRIDSAIDLDEIRYVAITQLGMVYPEEGQVITYANVDYDYVRKVGDGK